MHKINARWHETKSRPSKKKKLAAERAKMRWAKSSIIESPEPDLHSSRSEKKLKLFAEDKSEALCDSNEQHATITMISDDVWPLLLKELKCDNCGNNKLDIHKSTSYGYSTKLEITCQACNKGFGSSFASFRTKDSKQFAVNKDMVAAFLYIGKGFAALEKFSMIMGLNPMDRKTFDKYVHILSEENKDFQETVLKKSRLKVREEYEQLNSNTTDCDGILNLGVSFDGTWHRRGHSSLYGIGCVIDILTGLVIDYIVLSKYCHMCEVSKEELNPESPEFHIWYESHKSSGCCDKNYEGSSNAMEVYAANILWSRSIKECEMRYTTILSDGDAKTFLHLKERNIYGDEFEITKEECINHVAKRLGTALRNKVKECKMKGISIGGKRKGSLTENIISRLSNYYRRAITDNAPNVQEMKTAIFASLQHCSSSDAKPKHNKCPSDQNSWCFYNRAKAHGARIPSHTTMKTTLGENVVAQVLPVYQRLACDNLLKRCTSAKTQNSNESLHSVIWQQCSKDVFVTKKRLDIAVANAVSQFNMGCAATAAVKSENISSISVSIANKIDSRRVKQSVRRQSAVYKEKARNKKYKNKNAEKKLKKSEGKTYGAGAF